MAASKVKVTVIKKLSMKDIYGDQGAGAAKTLDPVCGLFN